MRRLALAAIVGLGALIFVSGAQACSCAPPGPVESLRRADAAIVGRLVEVIPRGRLQADYRYRIRRVYKGARSLARGRTISVRSDKRASACGLPRRQERPIGLFLVSDRGRWTAGICSVIEPHRLWAAAKHGYSGGPASAFSASCTS